MRGLTSLTPAHCDTEPPPPKGHPGGGSVTKIGISDRNIDSLLPNQNSEGVKNY